MDDLLAGFGKLLGTLQLGSVADWTAGLVAFVALLVAVSTQRRQLSDSRKEEANSLLASVQLKQFSGKDWMTVAYVVKLTNDSLKSKRKVQVALGSLHLSKPHGPIAFRPSVELKPPFDDLPRISDENGNGIRYNLGLVEPGQKTGLVIYARGVLDRTFFILYTDSIGNRWRRDLLTGEVRALQKRDLPDDAFTGAATNRLDRAVKRALRRSGK